MIMPIIINVQGVDKVIDMIGNIRGELPLAANRDAYNVAEMYGKALRDAMIFSGIVPDSWDLFESTKKVKKTGENRYMIAIPTYGYWLDAMSPHWIHKDQMKGRYNPAKNGDYPFIYVKPHPFIELGIDIANSRLEEKIANGEIIKTIRKGGK